MIDELLKSKINIKIVFKKKKKLSKDYKKKIL